MLDVGSIVCCQAVVEGEQASWLAGGSDASRNQLGKDIEWYNIATCFSVHFASQAPTCLLSQFSWQVDSCPGLSHQIYVDISDLDRLRVVRASDSMVVGDAAWML